MSVLDQVRARIARQGPISFADFMEIALYDRDGGFYTRGGGAGRAGRDFVTSPEVGTLFGALIARFLDATWRDLDQPDPFVVIEAGAGRGRLAADVLRAQPECAPALRYVLVELSPALRARQSELLRIEPIDEVLGPFVRAADPDEPMEVVPGAGPIVSSIEQLPAARVDGVVLANELLDNFPVRIVERTADGWDEVRVGLDDDGGLREVLVTAPSATSGLGDLPPDIEVGARIPLPVGLGPWLDAAAGALHRGDIVVIDYVAAFGELVARGQPGWLRTYRGHGRGAGALDDPGDQDITSDVPLECLRTAATRAGLTIATEVRQADWLQTLGIDALVARARQTWHERAGVGDLEALAARSWITEAAALTDPDGLGAHRVVVFRR